MPMFGAGFVPRRDEGGGIAKPTFFGEGGAGRTIAGYIGDALLSASGRTPIFAPMLQQRQAQQQQLADWQAKQQWELVNRAPAQPHYFEANNGDQYAVGPDGNPQRIFADPTPKTTWVTAENGDGTKTLVPFVNGQPAQAQGMGLPQGFTVRPKGGASPQGSRPFR